MPVVANYLVPDRQVPRTLTAQAEASSTAALPHPAPLPIPEANFIPLYVLLALVPLTFLAVGLWACRLERRAARAQASAAGDIELQTLRTFWFPWREAVEAAHVDTATAAAAPLAPEAVTTSQHLSSRFSLDESPTPRAKRGRNNAAAAAAAVKKNNEKNNNPSSDTDTKKTSEAAAAAALADGASRLLSRLRAGEATTTLPTTIKDWRSVHAALLPHRFGPSPFPGRGGHDDGGPVSPTISAPSFIGSSVVSIGAGPEELRSSWVSGGAAAAPAAPAAVPCKVVRFAGEGCEEGEEEEDCKGKGKGRAGVQVTTRSVVVSNPQDGEMF
ncbi:hypothetical protein HYQ45_001507 [Verticillium longisporum]|uniref:Uncharacterized protein n=1 Tax=Verticillium longisporum TaxID=100787 RepID=A0A8I2ZZ54_VERLO|nr:hypothetical protein HYQ45_001507 [Verticillium longisporum]